MLAADPHLLFPQSHAGATEVIFANEFTASLLKGDPDRPYCTSPKRHPALKSGNSVSG